jgi:hypothetical protein
LLLLLCFFGGGEEIIWGQRIFVIQTPDALAAINARQETNIHNVDLFEYHIHFEAIFDLFRLFLTIALPFAENILKPLGDFVSVFFAVPRFNIGLLFPFDYLCAETGTVIFQSHYVLM